MRGLMVPLTWVSTAWRIMAGALLLAIVLGFVLAVGLVGALFV